MTTIQKRRGTAAQWSAANPVLAAGEPGYETDTGREKTGNGVSTWNQLEYILGADAVRVEIGNVTGDLTNLTTTAKDDLVSAINEAAQTGGTTTTDPTNTLLKDQNLADVVDKQAARDNLQLGSGAVTNVGTTAGDIPALGAGNILPATLLGTGVGATRGSKALYDDGTFKTITAGGTAVQDADMVQTAEGKGGARLLIEGADVITGAADEIVLSNSFADTRPPGIDVDGGQVGCSLADPGMVIPPRYDANALTDPYRTDLEAGGQVLVLSGAYARVATRVKLFDDRIDRITYFVGEGSGLSVAGTVSIVDPATGATLSYGTVNLSSAGTGTPAAIPVGGEVRTYSLLTALIDLAITDVVVILSVGSAGGAVRLAARGIANMAQPSSPTGLRLGGSLIRSGGQTGSATDVPSAAKVWDLGAAWTKRPTPMLLLTRSA